MRCCEAEDLPGSNIGKRTDKFSNDECLKNNEFQSTNDQGSFGH
jgi:hypothetical protein